MKSKFYQFEIALLNVDPLVWRSFVVPSTITLSDLHFVIQMVMGWTDSHLHEFIIGKKRYASNEEFELFDDSSTLSEDFQLCDLVKRKGAKITYVYDFGDDWQHLLTLENSNYKKADSQADFVCLEGENACPPEDVGGPWGYDDFCEIIKDPSHEEHQDYLDWVGEDFNPKLFEIHYINEALRLCDQSFKAHGTLLPQDIYDD